MYRNEIPHDPHHLAVPSGASKMISELMICSSQTLYLSCVKIRTIAKKTESSFHLSLITKEYHQVCQKRFQSQWNIWHKIMHLSCTDTNTISKWTKTHEPHHLGDPTFDMNPLGWILIFRWEKVDNSIWWMEMTFTARLQPSKLCLSNRYTTSNSRRDLVEHDQPNH
jgi:hypothetical protein